MEISFTLPASHKALLYYYNGTRYISTGKKTTTSFNPQDYGYYTYLLQVTKDYPSHANINQVRNMNMTVHTVSYDSYIPNTQYRILALEAKVPDIDEAYSISTSSVVGNNVAHITTKANIFANTDMEKVYYRVNGNIWNREWNNVIHNPVMSINFPDPTIIKVGNYYYMAATTARIALYKSMDLANWEYVKRIIPSDFDYSQVNNVTSFWAPELNYIDGRYICFLSANTGDSNRFTFSMVADDIEGDWEFNSITVNVAGKNQIDPAYAEENDVKYIFCGSWSGIYRYVLDDETLAATDAGTQVVRTNIEATVLYKYGDYWYMFTSSGDTFTYAYCIHIARSATLDGTFVNKNGQSSVDAAGTKILSSASTDILLGPGHPSNIITANGKMYMLFHNMIKGLEGSGTNAIRYPMLMRIVEGPDGWLAFADKDGNVVTKPTWETTVM
jgi:beta-xylosidase